MDKLKRFFSGKRIFLTGHTGFKGAWLGFWLNELGAEVCGYSLEPPSQPNLFGAIGLNAIGRSERGDVRDFDYLFSVLKQFQPEIILHLAAQSLVRDSYREPLTTYQTNILGTVNLLEVVRRLGGPRVVLVITSDKCYANRGWVYGYREDDRLGGNDPYSSSKACAELVITAYRNSFFPPEKIKQHRVVLASARAGNVIGGGDWASERLVPDCMRALSSGETIIIRNPRAVRPWQFVLEPLAGYLELVYRLAETGAEFAGAWNFGPPAGDLATVEEVVKSVIEQWGKGTHQVVSDQHFSEAQLLKLDCSRAYTYLDWRPVYPLSTAISETVTWYKMFYQGLEPAGLIDFSRQQITRYQDAMMRDKS